MNNLYIGDLCDWQVIGLKQDNNIRMFLTKNITIITYILGLRLINVNSKLIIKINI